MRSRVFAVAAFVVVTYGCATSAPPKTQPELLHGVASWYGEEFAGRTTANGEIFDPALLTAAHRALPFGTILDVTNAKTRKTVRVRVNDRGPYVGNRVIDLSHAAAQQIGLIEPGVGEVEIKVVKLGNGEREPPVPFEVTITDVPKSVPVVPAGVPDARPPDTTQTSEPEVVVDRVQVEAQRGGVVTRRQVSPDGRTLEEVSVEGAVSTPTAAAVDDPAHRAPPSSASRSDRGAFFVQVGAFALEANAKTLQEKLASLGQSAFIDRGDLYRVRLGPFATREQAVEARTVLEAKGLSAMIVAE